MFVYLHQRGQTGASAFFNLGKIDFSALETQTSVVWKLESMCGKGALTSRLPDIQAEVLSWVPKGVDCERAEPYAPGEAMMD
eukprot:1287463-Amorphochlora_amoeboformis.AAC.1